MLNITCEDNMALMARYGDDHFDLAIVDPPYGIGMGGGKWGNSKVDFKQFHGEDNCTPTKEYFAELKRVAKNYIVWGGNYMTEYLPPTPCYIVWDKVQPEDFTMAMCEIAFTSFDTPAKIYKQRVVGADTSGKVHPTQKPVKLYEWLLMKYAKEGDLILDTHLGSGSIAVACEKHGFDLTACEIDQGYYDIAMARIAHDTAQVSFL